MRMIQCGLTVATVITLVGLPCFGIIATSTRSGEDVQLSREAASLEKLAIACQATLMEGAAHLLRMVPLARQSAKSLVLKGGIAKVAAGIERVYAGTPDRPDGYAVITALLRAEAAGHEPILLAGPERPFILLRKNIRCLVVNRVPTLEIQEGFLNEELEKWLHHERDRAKVVVDGGPPPQPPKLYIDYMADIQSVIEALVNIDHGIRLVQKQVDANNQEQRYRQLLLERYAIPVAVLKGAGKTAGIGDSGRWLHTLAANGNIYLLGRAPLDTVGDLLSSNGDTEKDRKRRRMLPLYVIVPPPPPPPPEWAFLPLNWVDDDNDRRKRRGAGYILETTNTAAHTTWQPIEIERKD